MYAIYFRGCCYFYDVYTETLKRVGYSSISRGKSNCSKVAIAMCGNYPKGCISHLSESHARAYLASGLPFLYDDPSSDTVLKPLLMNAFGGAEMATSRNQLVANCGPLVTANEYIIEQLSISDERYGENIVCADSHDQL